MMKRLKMLAVVDPLVGFPILIPSGAQDYAPIQVQDVDRDYNGRIGGRPNHIEGLPPSAADKGKGIYDNPIDADDCREVEMFAPDARPGWQARVWAACDEQ